MSSSWSHCWELEELQFEIRISDCWSSVVFSEHPRQAPVSFWTSKEAKGTSEPGLFSLNLLGFKPHMIFWKELEFETKPGCLSVQGSLISGWRTLLTFLGKNRESVKGVCLGGEIRSRGYKIQIREMSVVSLERKRRVHSRGLPRKRLSDIRT